MKNLNRRIIAIIAAIAMTIVVIPNAASVAETNVPQDVEIWDGSIATGFASGMGSTNNPYIITTAAELAYLAQQVNSGVAYDGKCFELANDIYLNDTSDWKNWGKTSTPANEWTAIGGNDGNGFAFAVFNGNGHTVYGLYINKPESDYQGLFGYCCGGEMSYLNVAESYVCGRDYVAGLVGMGESENSEFDPAYCTNGAKVVGETYVGGVMGYYADASWYSYATDCHNLGSVTGVENVGGVFGAVGYAEYTSINYCFNAGKVNGETNVGGVIGHSRHGCIYECYNSGSVNGTENVGGLFGLSEGTCCDTFNSYNSGDITGERYVGGFIGHSSLSVEDGVGIWVQNSYNAGTITGQEFVGALVGSYGPNDYEPVGAYYLDTCCEQGDIYGTALTHEQMQLQESFDGYRFDYYWEINPESGYLYPQLFDNPHCMPVEDDEPNGILGDANGDGIVTLADANIILRYSLGFGQLSDEIIPLCDINDDGVINVQDATLTARIALSA